MTKEAKKVLNHLKRLTNNTPRIISYLYDSTCITLEEDDDSRYDYVEYKDEIETIIDLLVEEKYLQYDYANRYNSHLTQKGLHIKQFTWWSIKMYLKDKFIDILALIISIIALIRSFH